MDLAVELAAELEETCQNFHQLFAVGLNLLTSRLFNWGNTLFARQGFIKAYEAGHAGLLSNLKRM